MAIPSIPDPLEQFVKKHTDKTVTGKEFVHKQGLWSSIKLVFRNPLKPEPIVFPSGMVVGARRIRIQGAVTRYDPENQIKLADKRYPKVGEPRGLTDLKDDIIEQTKELAAGFDLQDTSEEYLKKQLKEDLDMLAGQVRDKIRTTWGLVMTLAIMADQPDTVHTKVTVPCSIRGWPRPVDITHEIRLREVDPERAATAGGLSKEQLSTWATERLEVITKDKLATYTIDQVVKRFARPLPSLLNGGGAADGMDSDPLEDLIKQDVSAKAREMLGYEVDLYTATPELGMGGLSRGFTVEVDGEYRTKSFHEGNFSLITNFKVTIGNLTIAIERKWLDPAFPDRDVIEHASKDITTQVRSAIQRALAEVETYSLLSEFGGAVAATGVQDKVRNQINSVMKDTFLSTISDFSVSLSFQDKLSAFRGDITRTCHGSVKFQYKPGTPDEINFNAGYSTRIAPSEQGFGTFFQVCFREITQVDSVKQRIEDLLTGHALQFLQTGGMMTEKAMLSLVAAPPEMLIESIFSAATAAIQKDLGLQVTVGPLGRSLPQRWKEDEKLKVLMEEKLRDLKLAAVSSQAAALADIGVPELMSERIDEVEAAVAKVGGVSRKFAEDLARIASSPLKIQEPGASAAKAEDPAPAATAREEARRKARETDRVIDAEIDGEMKNP